MRYTPLYRVIAILLSVIMLLGSTSVLAEFSEATPTTEIIEPNDTSNDPDPDPVKDDDDSDNEDTSDLDPDETPDDGEPGGDDDSDIGTPNDDDDETEPDDDDEVDEIDEEEDSDEDYLEFEELMLLEEEVAAQLFFFIDLGDVEATGSGTFIANGREVDWDRNDAPWTDGLPVPVQVGDVIPFQAIPNQGSIVKWGRIEGNAEYISGGKDDDEYANVRITGAGSVNVFVVFKQVELELSFDSPIVAILEDDPGTQFIGPAKVLVMPRVALNVWATARLEGNFFPLWVYQNLETPEPHDETILGHGDVEASDPIRFNMPPYDIRVVRKPIPGQEVTFNIVDDTGSVVNNMGTIEASFTWIGNQTPTTILSSPGVVPQGANLAFTAPQPPAEIVNFLGYEWRVDGELARPMDRNPVFNDLTNIQDDVEVTVTLVQGFEVNFRAERFITEAKIDGETAAATFGVPPVTTPVTPDNNIVRENSSLTFSAPENVGFDVYEYQWRVRENGGQFGAPVIKPQFDDAGVIDTSAGIFQIYPLAANIEVVVTIVRGHNVTFGVRDGEGGSVEAFRGASTNVFTSGTFLPEGDLTPPITFTATNPIGMDVMAYSWFVNEDMKQTGPPEDNSEVFVLDNLASERDNIDVRVSFKQGHRLTLGIGEGLGQLEANTDPPAFIESTPTLQGADVERLVEENDVITFTATPLKDIPNGIVYRISHWMVDEHRQEATILSDGTSVLTLPPITGPVDVYIHFVEVTFDITPKEITVRGQEQAFIFSGPPEENVDPETRKPGFVIEIDSNSDEDIEINRGDLPAGITIDVVKGHQVGDSFIDEVLIINSDSTLTYKDNRLYEVEVTREGITRTLTIHVLLPYMYIDIVDPDTGEVDLDLEEVVIKNNQLTGTVILRSNAPYNPPYELTGLPDDLKDIIEFSDPPVEFILDDRGNMQYEITITADRSTIQSLIDNEMIELRISRGGVSETFKLNITLTPPPLIKSITYTLPTDIFDRVRVHGTIPTGDYFDPIDNPLPSSLLDPARVPGVVIAEFIIDGENLDDPEDEDDVKKAIIINSLPDWIEDIDPADVVVNILSSTEATVTVPIIVKHNLDADAHRNTPPVILGIDTNVLPGPKGSNHSDVTGELNVYQYGPITLNGEKDLRPDPNDENDLKIGNQTLPADIIVAGSGPLGRVEWLPGDDAYGVLLDLIRLDFAKDLDDNDVIRFSLIRRPSPTEDDIEGEFTVRIWRDGLSADLTIRVELTSLDRPTVVWPVWPEIWPDDLPGEIKKPIYGDSLSAFNVGYYDGDGIPTTPPGVAVGLAYFDRRVEGYIIVREIVEGTFSWGVNPGLVGNAGPRTPVMIFTPFLVEGEERYATVSGNADMFVHKADPNVTWPTVSIVYGTSLANAVPESGSTGSGSASFPLGDGTVVDVSGEFVFAKVDGEDHIPEVSESGNLFWVTFTPNDGDELNFNTATRQIQVIVTPAPQDAPPRPIPLIDDTVVEPVTPISITLENFISEQSGLNAEFVIRTENRRPEQESDWVDAISLSDPRAFLTFDHSIIPVLPNTTYYFFARYPAGPNHLASESSLEGPITTLKADLRGDPEILVNDDEAGPTNLPTYLDTLSVDRSMLYTIPPGDDAEGIGRDIASRLDYEYRWYRTPIDGLSPRTLITTTDGNGTYILTGADVDHWIHVEIYTESANDDVRNLRLTDPLGPVLRKLPVHADFEYSFDELTYILAEPPTATPNRSVKTYNGDPLSVSVRTVTGIVGMGDFTVEYRLSDSDNDDDWTEDKPTDVGIYHVRIAIEQGANYLAADLILNVELEITKAAPAIGDLEATLDWFVGTTEHSENLKGATAATLKVDWNSGFLATPPVAIVTATDVIGLGTITPAYYVVGKGFTDNNAPPTLPAEVLVYVNIAEGTNFAATENPIYIGTYEIVGIPIPTGEILGDRNVVVTYDGQPHGIAISDSPPYTGTSVVMYSLVEDNLVNNLGSATSPTFTDATTDSPGYKTIYFRVERPDTGYRPYYGTATVTINQRQLEWDVGKDSGNPAEPDDKIYDGLRTADVLNPPTLASREEEASLTGVIPGDDVDVVLEPESVKFSQSDYSPTPLAVEVDPGGWSLEGGKANNYIAPVEAPVFSDANINRRQLTWSIGIGESNPALVSDKPFDGLTTANVSRPPNFGNVVDGETIPLFEGTVNFADSEVGSHEIIATGWGIEQIVAGDPVGVIDGAPYGNYYSPAGQPYFAPAEITAIRLSWVIGSESEGPLAATVKPKEYDGDREAEVLLQPTLTGMGSTSEVTVVLGPVLFAQSDVGVGPWTVEATTWELGGRDGGNYLKPLEPPLFASERINPKQLEWVVGFDEYSPARVQTRPYNGDTNATAHTTVPNTPTITGFAPGETPAAPVHRGTVAFQNANAGTDKEVDATGWGVTIAGVTGINGARVGNYLAPQGQPYFVGDITQLQLSWTTGIVSDKEYDRNTSATVTTAPTLQGIISPDVVNVSTGTATFEDENVGNSKTVTGSGWGITGPAAGNYSIPGQPTFAPANITPLQLTWTTGTVSDKVYDRNTNATVTSAPTLQGVISPDVVTVTPGTASFNDPNVANGIGVTGLGWGIGGASAGNYSIPGQPDFNPANITPLQLSWTTGTVINKVYDRNTNATITGAPTLQGVISPDVVTVTPGTASFNDPNVANGIGVTGSGWGIGGASSGNYSLPAEPVGQPPFNPANITHRQITWSTGVVSDKEYDSNTNTTITTAPAPVGVLEGDVVTVTPGGTASFYSPNAANGIRVIGSSWYIEGASAGNYTIVPAQPLFANANITPKQLTWTIGTSSSPATVETKIYDRTPLAKVENEPTLSGIINPLTENVTVVLDPVNFSQVNVGTDLAVTATTWRLGGTDAGNYLAPTDRPVFANADIEPRQLEWEIGAYNNRATVSNKVFDGTDIATIQRYPTLKVGGDHGVVSGDTVLPESGTARFSLPAPDAHNDLPVTATGWSITGTSTTLDNYLAPADEPYFTNANITPRTITGSVRIDDSTGFGIREGAVLEADVSHVIGIPETGGTTGTTGISGVTLTYQWYRDGRIIPGATGSTYTVEDASVDPIDARITVRVTGTINYTGTLISGHVAVGRTPIGGAITITGETEEGGTLTLSLGDVTPSEAIGSLTIAWLRDGVPIEGETEGTYIITKDDLGKTITVIVTGTGAYTGDLISNEIPIPAVRPHAPENLTAVPGDGQVTLSWEPGFDGGSPIINYQVSYDDGDTWYDVGLYTKYTVTGLTNDRPYTFLVRAVNVLEDEFGSSVNGYSLPATVDETPLATPIITSITPTEETEEEFTRVQTRGITAEAVFIVEGLNFSDRAFEVYPFILTLPTWIIQDSDIVVVVNDDKEATVTVTLRVRGNSGPSRAFNVSLGVPSIPGSLQGTLRVSQDGRSTTEPPTDPPTEPPVEPPVEPPTEPEPEDTDDTEEPDDLNTDDLDDSDDDYDPYIESGNGAGGTGSGTGGSGGTSSSGFGGGDDLNIGSSFNTGSRMGFWEWLRENTWWIWAYLAAMLAFAFWWFILLWRRRKKDDEDDMIEPPPNGPGQHMPVHGSP